MQLRSISPNPSTPSVAFVPLYSTKEGEETLWIGTAISRLLGEHLMAANVNVIEHERITQTLIAEKHSLPLTQERIALLKQLLKASVLIHGRFVLDEDGKMLGLRLIIDGNNRVHPPLEAAAPMAGFGRFIGRMSLALLEGLEHPLTEVTRKQIDQLPRPVSFEAFRQLTRAKAAWASGQKHLALAAANSAQAFDPDLEEAIAVEVAIAREAADIETAKTAFARWIEFARKRGSLAIASERLLMLGHWMLERGEWNQARHAYEEARELAKRTSDEIGETRALNNLANLDLLSGRTHEAVKTYRRSLRIFELSPDGRADTAMTFFNLAAAHKNLGQQEEALRAVEEALQLARQIGDTHLQARCMAQRGALYDDLGEWQKANADYSQAANLMDALQDEVGRAVVKSHQALLLKEQGAYARVEQLMLEALATFSNPAFASPHEQAVISLNLADLYFTMGHYTRAWDLVTQADDVFEKYKSWWRAYSRALIETLEEIPETDTTGAGMQTPDGVDSVVLANGPLPEIPSLFGPSQVFSGSEQEIENSDLDEARLDIPEDRTPPEAGGQVPLSPPRL